MNKIDMTKYGLINQYAAFAEEASDKYKVGRILSQEKGIYRLVSEDCQQLAEISGKFRYNAASPSDYPAVGDFVLIEGAGNGSHAVIREVLPRKSVFIRKAAGTGNKEQVVAANIDIIFICMSLNNDFNIRRLERYLSVAWDSGAKPVIVLTKADLCHNISEKLFEAQKVSFGTDIVVTSSYTSEGFSEISKYIKEGITIALMGSSGAGKSTIINKLVGKDILETSGLRNDDKGRHTSTRRELILLAGGGMLMDTPGMRELGVMDSTEGINRSFSDIEELIEQCKFSNCTHNSEPGCAIKAALKSGELSEDRWLSYVKLTKENKYNESTGSYLSEKKEKFKTIAKINKSNARK